MAISITDEQLTTSRWIWHRRGEATYNGVFRGIIVASYASRLVCYPQRHDFPAIQVFHNTGAHTHRITGPRYNLHPSTEAHLGSSPASIAKAIYPVAHLSAQANANPRFIWNRKPKDLQAAGSKA